MKGAKGSFCVADVLLWLQLATFEQLMSRRAHTIKTHNRLLLLLLLRAQRLYLALIITKTVAAEAEASFWVAKFELPES